MSVVGSLFLFVVCFSSASASWWMDDFYWYEQKPSECPYEDPISHVCSNLTSGNFTCITIACCDYFERDDEVNEYDGDYTSEEDDDETVYYYGRIDDSCRICYSVKNCTLYQCRRRCCDGYTTDAYGRCQNKSGEIDCQNGGTPYQTHYYYRSEWKCSCPKGFSGRSCEIPMCNCENGGECMEVYGRPWCNCSTGFVGDRCEQAVCQPACQNGGKCMKDGYRQFCSCPESYVGKYCEHYFKQSLDCPAPKYDEAYIGEFCYSDAECGYGQVCCKEGASTYCRERHQDYCEYEGQRYEIGQSYTSSDSCMICECLGDGDMPCMIIDCMPLYCDNPIKKPGQCCGKCPDDRPNELGLECPTHLVKLETDYRRNLVTLTQQNTGVRVQYDPYMTDVKVLFEPKTVRHCHCRQSCKEVYKVVANAKSYTEKASCEFKVVVKDTEAPRIISCPDNIYIFEDELPAWREPMAVDNVGISYVIPPWEPRYLSVGNYSNKYVAFDYDRNAATCYFRITVSSRDTPVEQLPQGMRDRSTGFRHVHLAAIIAPVIGGLIILVAILVCVCCRVRSTSCRSERPARATRGTYENNIYALPGVIDTKPPVYSELPFNPPAYSETGSMKDYKPDAPPSYSNAGYETLPAVRGLVQTKDAYGEKKSIDIPKE